MKTPIPLYQSAIVVALVAGLLMLIPLTAMQFTDEVVWSPFDFAVAWTLLFGAGFTYKLISRKANNIVYRIAVAASVVTALFLVWSNLAVGLVGNENNPFNLLYGGVLAVGIIGALFARFQPQGMAYTLFSTAIAQVLVALIALISGMQHAPESSVLEIIAVNGFFTALWSGSALLFLYSSHQKATAQRGIS